MSTLVCSAIKSEQRLWSSDIVYYYTSKIIEDRTKITVHKELNTSFSFHRELDVFLENHSSWLIMKSQNFLRKKQAISHFTGKKLGHSRITKYPLQPRSFTAHKMPKGICW